MHIVEGTIRSCASLALVAFSVCLFSTASGQSPASTAETLKLDRLMVVSAANVSKAETSAVALLVEEIERRTNLRAAVSNSWPAAPGPVVALGTASTAASWAGPHAGMVASKGTSLSPEGFSIHTMAGPAPAILIAGSDPRGVLFGVGRLLREFRMSRGQLLLPAGLNLTTAPKVRLRGHQMGYRPKTNSYDAWTEDIWKQYIRDLAVFGTNAVEMIPPRSDDDAQSPHFPLPPIEMMAKVSKILDDHDMDVWIWYPAMDPDYSKPETVAAALREWGQVFAKMPRLDAIFVPGGDPGHTAPGVLMGFLEKMTRELRRHHPRAGMWMSPQSFNREWLDEFLRIVRDQKPRWLAGLVYGPQTRITLPDLRAALPAQYPIRRYPDITHSLSCQYPVPDWDVAYALTEARECINPRPVDQVAVFRAYQEQSVGFITYSEGCNDDVNKFVWSGLGWDPSADVTMILLEFSRYFIGPEFEESFAQGLAALERNWRGPLLKNDAVPETLRRFQEMERKAPPSLLLNWRFQQALYRAYYDAYTRKRLQYETELEQRALEALRQAPSRGAPAAMTQAEALLQPAETAKTALDLRTRVFQLAEALYQSIRMQLSVPLYRAIYVGRGANLDTVDEPLNNRLWLRDRLNEARKLGSEAEQLKALADIVEWQNPGPGGFYDELGNPEARPHLVPGRPYAEDPAFFQSPVTGFAGRPGWRISWVRHADALFDRELRLRYDRLDPQARYRVRIVYAGALNNPVRLVADGGIEVHPMMQKPNPVRPVEFEVPPGATRDGTLVLSWTSTPGRGGAGRGPQVAEVWLLRQ